MAKFHPVRCTPKIIILAVVFSLVGGCATMRYGGAPEPSFNINADIKDLSQHFEGSTSITKFYANPSPEARNEFITGRLTLINLQYLKFIRSLTSERQLLDTATAISILGLGLSGSLVPLAETKAILAAVSAGLTGTKEAVDKNYYFQKTIPALVAQMNANREEALTPLLVGAKQSLEDDPLASAVVDLNRYYLAGTFSGAIEAIQANASVQEDAAKQENKRETLRAPSAQDQAANKILKAYFVKIYKELKEKGSITDSEKLRKALARLGMTVDPKITDQQVYDLLHGTLWQQGQREAEILQALRAEGIQL